MLEARSKLNLPAETRKTISKEDALEASILHDLEVNVPEVGTSNSKSTLRVGFPTVPECERTLQLLEHLQGMVNLSSVIVVVGFSEMGPWESSRTRWEMEHKGHFSQEEYIEMA